MGSDSQMIAFHPYDKSKPASKQPTQETAPQPTANVDDPMSDEDMEEDFGAIVSRKQDKSAEKIDDLGVAKYAMLL